jgi:hypothetical protein
MGNGFAILWSLAWMEITSFNSNGKRAMLFNAIKHQAKREGHFEAVFFTYKST